MQLQHTAVAIGEAWTFEAIGEVSRDIAEHASFSPDVHRLGVVDDLPGQLRRSAAVAVLSDLGRGFKTKILESIVCGAWVLVTPRLRARLPEQVQPFCVPVDANDSGSVRRALETLRSKPSPVDPNPSLKATAYAALDRFFR